MNESSDQSGNGLSRALEQHESQQEIAPGLEDEPEDDSDMVYVVASNYADDPHPHVEGVFHDREDANELKKKCAATTESPHPVAWQVIETEVS